MVKKNAKKALFRRKTFENHGIDPRGQFTNLQEKFTPYYSFCLTPF
jgi:hypothetical protein